MPASASQRAVEGKSGSAGKAYGRGFCNYCYKELISESQLADMYNALSGGKLAIATKKIGDERPDPAIPDLWAKAMYELVTADDSTGKPIFQPTMMDMEQPAKQKMTLSFSPARGKKRDAEHCKLLMMATEAYELKSMRQDRGSACISACTALAPPA